FADFQIITRSRSRPEPISDRWTLASISAELLAAQFPMRKGVRLIGLLLSSLCADPTKRDTQMTLAVRVGGGGRSVLVADQRDLSRRKLSPCWLGFTRDEFT